MALKRNGLDSATGAQFKLKERFDFGINEAKSVVSNTRNKLFHFIGNTIIIYLY